MCKRLTNYVIAVSTPKAKITTAEVQINTTMVSVGKVTMTEATAKGVVTSQMTQTVGTSPSVSVSQTTQSPGTSPPVEISQTGSLQSTSIQTVNQTTAMPATTTGISGSSLQDNGTDRTTLPSLTTTSSLLDSVTVSTAFTTEAASSAANEVNSSLSPMDGSTALQGNTSVPGTQPASTTYSPTSSPIMTASTSGSNETVTTYTEMNGTQGLVYTQTVENFTTTTPGSNATTPFVSTAPSNASLGDTTITNLTNQATEISSKATTPASNQVHTSLSVIDNSTMMTASTSASNETITTNTEMNGTQVFVHTAQYSTMTTPASNTTITQLVSTANVNASLGNTTITYLTNLTTEVSSNATTTTALNQVYPSVSAMDNSTLQGNTSVPGTYPASTTHSPTSSAIMTASISGGNETVTTYTEINVTRDLISSTVENSTMTTTNSNTTITPFVSIASGNTSYEVITTTNLTNQADVFSNATTTAQVMTSSSATVKSTSDVSMPASRATENTTEDSYKTTQSPNGVITTMSNGNLSTEIFTSTLGISNSTTVEPITSNSSVLHSNSTDASPKTTTSASASTEMNGTTVPTTTCMPPC